MEYFRNFAEFHANMTKKMPDATRFPEQYNLCYDLMKMTWDAARAEREVQPASSGIGLDDLIKERQDLIKERMKAEDKEKIVRAWHRYTDWGCD